MGIENLIRVLAPCIVGNSKNPAKMSDQEVCAESIRQQMIMKKLFDINRKYWNDLFWTNVSPPSISEAQQSSDGIPPSPEARSFRYGGKL